MARIRSPGYPSISLRQAIELADKLYNKSRQNVVERDAAAKDLGYKAITGQSAKMLADLAHYNLVERAGKGGVRVTDTAAKIIAHTDLAEKRDGLLEAAYSPGLFADIKDQWPDGFVSENALRSFLMRKGFASVAVHPAMKAYFDTYDLLRQEGATESHRATSATTGELISADVAEQTRGALISVAPPPTFSVTAALPAIGPEVSKMGGTERVVFVEEAGPAQYLKLVASGELDAGMLEALEDYIKRQKKRLEAAQKGTAGQAPD
jgi:hypothetical protein